MTEGIELDLTLNEVQLMQEALELMANALHCEQDAIINCLVGVLISEIEADRLRFSLL